MQTRKNSGISWLGWGLFALAVAGGALAIHLAGGAEALFAAFRARRGTIVYWVDGHYAQAVGLFILIYMAAVMLSLPGAAWLTVAGGLVFGSLAATAYAVAGATAGAVGVFLIARFLLGDALRSWGRTRAGPAIQRMEAGFRENALSYLLLLRLVPLFPFWLVNLVPAFLNMPLRLYIVGTFLGIIPGTFVYASVGEGLGAVVAAGHRPDLDMILSIQVLGPLAGLALLAAVPILYKFLRREPGRHG